MTTRSCVIFTGLGMALGLVAPGAQAQSLVLNTGQGEPLVTGSRSLPPWDPVQTPRIALDVAFGTYEQSGPGRLQDSLTLTFQDASSGLTFVLLTMDASGVTWMPATPGGVTIDPAQLTWEVIPFPSLASTVPDTRSAYHVSTVLPESFAGISPVLYADLFDNQDAFGSVGWVQTVAVPEPESVFVTALGICVLLLRRLRVRCRGEGSERGTLHPAQRDLDP